MSDIAKQFTQIKQPRNVNTAFWVKGRDIIEISDSKHISYIIKNPERFGISEEEINNIYKKHNEPFGLEGKAREEIIMLVAKLGWIRVRHYIRPQDYWTIQTDNIKKTMSTILSFINWALLEGKITMTDELRLLSYDTGDMINYSYQSGGVNRFLKDYQESVKKLFKMNFIEAKMEETVTITKLIIGFPKDIVKGWTNLHQPMEPFSSRWGRGVVDTEGECIIGSYGTDHSSLRKKLTSGTILTFYYGYDYAKKVLYLQSASIGTNELFNNKTVLNSILNVLKTQGNSPIKGFVIRK